MRRFLAVLFLLVAISLPAFAGDTESPGGITPTPTPTPMPCTGFCPDDPGSSSMTSSDTSEPDEEGFLSWLYEQIFGI
jgi:hypothetical protein